MYYRCLFFFVLRCPTFLLSSTNRTAIDNGLSQTLRLRHKTKSKRVRGRGGGHSKDFEVLTTVLLLEISASSAGRRELTGHRTRGEARCSFCSVNGIEGLGCCGRITKTQLSYKGHKISEPLFMSFVIFTRLETQPQATSRTSLKRSRESSGEAGGARKYSVKLKKGSKKMDLELVILDRGGHSSSIVTLTLSVWCKGVRSTHPVKNLYKSPLPLFVVTQSAGGPSSSGLDRSYSGADVARSSK
ncbi:hypothetical protein EVAR_46794_1 [Eumeta japonica]|uniref:Secreted protein n=1 Tax=Eumeta variegata TaxID=151549 RepID=A0A4C1XD71_EUMVA|nr:hypothetical protein EVAR_46794_1 [Eumeta japonica]